MTYAHGGFRVEKLFRPGWDPSSGRNALLTGGTSGGPAAGTVNYHRNHVNSSAVLTNEAGAELTRIVYLEGVPRVYVEAQPHLMR